MPSASFSFKMPEESASGNVQEIRLLELLKKLVKLILDYLKKEASKVLKRWIFATLCFLVIVVIVVLITIFAAKYAPGFYRL